MKYLIFIFCLMIIFIQISSVEATISWRGYLENRLYIIQNHPHISMDNYLERINIGNFSRFRLELKGKAHKNVRTKLALDLYNYSGFFSPSINLLGEKLSLEQRLNIDRAYVKIYFDKFDLILGKQSIIWGVSRVWMPLDIFNRANILDISEERAGVNAINVKYPLGKLSSMNLVIVPEDSLQTSRGGFRLAGNLLHTDLGANFIWESDKEEYTLGLDIRADTEIGWWLEARHTFADSIDDYWQTAIGIDYSIGLFNRSLIFMMEYFYDETGIATGDYDTRAIYTLSRTTLAQDYIYTNLTFMYSDFTTYSLNNITNINDASGIIISNIMA